MAETAGLGDNIGHTHALAGLVRGTLLGAVLIVAVGLLTLGSGLVVAAIADAAAASAGSVIRNSVASSGASSGRVTGSLTQGCSAEVCINGRAAAMVTRSQADPSVSSL